MLHDYKVGDEVWWFKVKFENYLEYLVNIKVDNIQLVHDIVTKVSDDEITCFHVRLNPSNIWGKSRQEAWNKLKETLEVWGKLE
jgi:hypothetical protein